MKPEVGNYHVDDERMRNRRRSSLAPSWEGGLPGAQGTLSVCIRWKPVQREVSGVQELPFGGPLVVNKEKLENMYLSIASREP